MGVDLGRHLVREQVEVSPGQLHVGQREHTYSSQTVNIGFNDFFCLMSTVKPEKVQVTLTLASGNLRDLNEDSVTGE